MLEMIYAIPENVGWALVGAAGASIVMALVALGKTLYLAISYRLDDEFEA